jgi:hypothetical protein
VLEAALENIDRTDQNDSQPVRSTTADLGDGALLNTVQRRVWRKPSVCSYDALLAQTGPTNSSDGGAGSS